MVTENNLAIYVLNYQGYRIAQRIIKFYSADIFIKKGILDVLEQPQDVIVEFSSLKHIVEKNFFIYKSHVFICATGIVVRTICPFICSKDKDPAVIVIDAAARFVISLLSGHLGGANKLSRDIAGKIGAISVITTATDSFNLPAIDDIAREKNLKIDNIKKIKTINSAILNRDPIWVYDPLGILSLERYFPSDYPLMKLKESTPNFIPKDKIGIICDFKNHHKLDNKKIILYPKIVYVGIGCNSNTPVDEIFSFFYEILSKENISIYSIKAVVTTDKKQNEKGIIEFAKKINAELIFIEHYKLNMVDVPNPSKQVKKHMGVFSVCEAAAIIASKGKLIVQKMKTKNVTIAMAIKC